MKTVNREGVPKADCWACENGECQILTETCCARNRKCGHYKTLAQHRQSIKKAAERCEIVGIKK